ncbi:Arc family DNA-binding protein [Rhizobium bangladeshense]|uniref:Arc family DNA-binding protein n=1 Tax=Rhizobium bangladeshense TaxID=1138189 RepID=UPI001C9031F8|nr:Arc family DNA-binding protein [Rhizobium bangladeshense]MBY3597543.1 Arc family DNA-binding protein [Rhizobium bangladeshense]
MAENDEVRITLRLTEGMRDELKSASVASGRSMNAEILHRLERALQWEEDGEKEANALIASLEAKLAEAISVNEYLEALKVDLIERLDRADEARQDQTPSQEEPIFNIVLDAKGHPISWPEVAAHIHRTAKAAGVETVSFRVAVFDADRQSSGDRDREYARLVRWYQEQTRKHKAQIREEK